MSDIDSKKVLNTNLMLKRQNSSDRIAHLSDPDSQIIYEWFELYHKLNPRADVHGAGAIDILEQVAFCPRRIDLMVKKKDLEEMVKWHSASLKNESDNKLLADIKSWINPE